MSVDASKETLSFQSEVTQLLHLMIHSLYSNREIFLRELISNASDACDKLRFEALGNDALLKGDSELRIQIDYDADAHTITVRDNGIGMSRDEVISNIGTIAKSGTKEFLQKLTGDQVKDANLIGQFGVGFYSAFIVAESVEMRTLRAGEPTSAGVKWSSDGTGEYTLEADENAKRGTEIVLHLKEEHYDLLNDWQLRSIINKYSDHVALPIQMRELNDEGKPTAKWEVVNKASALWVRPKNEISDEDYTEFYKHVGHDMAEPLAWTHNRVEGKTEFISLLYIPSKAPFDLYEPDQKHGVKLYVRRVFIMDDAEKLMPRYMRFVKGVIDSSDLPLNVSREILQDNKIIDTIRSGCVKKVLGTLKSMAINEADKYQSFWNEFGKVLKEGPAEDFSNKEDIAGLLRFSSTHDMTAEQNVSLQAYIERMQESQDKIYYITADSFNAAKNSPHLEVFKKKGIEVLLMTDRVDEWLMSYLTEFDGKSFVSIAKGELNLDEFADEEEKKQHEATEKESKDILLRIKKALNEKVEDVRVSHRLTSSPACIVLNEHEMALYMQALMKQAGQNLPPSKPVLEINPSHPILQKMKDSSNEEQLTEWSNLIFDQAVLAEGGQLEDPASFVARMNQIIIELAH